MRGLGVLQVEPTDRCNLSCTMCRPHAEGWAAVHGKTPQGLMDADLFRKLIDDIVADDLEFDHLILQWLGEPTLHPDLFDLLDYAVSRAGDRFDYFRFDTNAIAMGPARIARLVATVRANPGRSILVVLSLDAATRETYLRVKGADAFDRVEANLQALLAARQELDPARHRLHLQLQFVVQEGNAGEAGAFVQRWRKRLAAFAPPRFADEIMLKRLSDGTGGEAQARADALYDRTLAEQGIRPFEEAGLALRIWEARPWES